MLFQPKLEDITLYLIETLADYEVIPANFGWHIHFQDEYCGLLEYQEKTGWQGSALNHLPPTLVEELKKFTLSDSVYSNLPYVA